VRRTSARRCPVRFRCLVALLALLVAEVSAGCSSGPQSDSGTTASRVTSTTGKVAIAPQFSYAQTFGEGLAAVRIGDDTTGNWGYIDLHGMTWRAYAGWLM
jgi:hypothetical protein